MKAKEKAVELVGKYYSIVYKSDERFRISETLAKQCAIIAVDEMIRQNGDLYLNGIDKDYYTKKNFELFELKTEIEKL